MPSKAQAPKTLQGDARRAVETCAGWNVRAAARRITQFLESRMQSAGVSFAQFGLMAEIAAATDDSISALAARALLRQPDELAPLVGVGDRDLDQTLGL